ncbi:hypothetical protein [Polymorphum gilvum]|nr:hypothetical protein [Polymorphum gilvum]
MTLFIGTISQKGGVGKSTLARLIAREYALAGWNVKIADLEQIPIILVHTRQR